MFFFFLFNEMTDENENQRANSSLYIYIYIVSPHTGLSFSSMYCVILHLLVTSPQLIVNEYSNCVLFGWISLPTLFAYFKRNQKENYM